MPTCQNLPTQTGVRVHGGELRSATCCYRPVMRTPAIPSETRSLKPRCIHVNCKPVVTDTQYARQYFELLTTFNGMCLGCLDLRVHPAQHASCDRLQTPYKQLPSGPSLQPPPDGMHYSRCRQHINCPAKLSSESNLGSKAKKRGAH
jgi:hypothetical protein